MEEGYSATTRAKPTSSHDPVSKSDLISSAKVIADAAKSALSHDASKVDKAQVAGAAADLLSAAKQYGHFEEKSFGKYVDKAEGYLHQYHSSHSSTTSSAAGTAHSGDGKHGHSSGGGAGDYIKLAQGFLKKDDHSQGEGHGSGGAGDYIKLAQGFLKKH